MSTEATNAIIYCDESGNSGPNYLDRAQPFYVLAGWAVPDEAIVDVSVAVEQLRQKICPQRSELKASVFLKGDRQKEAAAGLFRRLGNMGCIPLFLVAEKNYCVAGKIVETFLDPFYNKGLRSAFTSDVVTKQELAETFYSQLPDDILARFAMAYRNPTTERFQATLKEIVDIVRERVNPELGSALAGSSEEIEDIAQSGAGESILGKVSATLNMPCLVSFLMLVENLGRIGFLNPRKLVHDEQHAYGDGYEELFKIHRGMHEWFVRLPHDDVQYMNIENIMEFEMASSVSRAPIQAADLLAGVINYFFIASMTEADLTAADAELAELTVYGLLVTSPRLTWMVCSNECLRRLGTRLFAPLRHVTARSQDDTALCRQMNTESAPLLPVLGKRRATHDGPVFKFEVPVYGLLDTSSNELMVLDAGDTDRSGESLPRTALPVFTTDAAARAFLGSYAPEERPQGVEAFRFGPGEMPRFLQLLENGTRWTEVMTVDPLSENQTDVHLPRFIDGLRQSLDRIQRAFRSGFDRFLLQKHTFSGRDVMSMLTSDGKYVATIPPDGRLYEGQTRAEAIEALRRGEGI